MINEEVKNPKVFNSPYGYIEIDSTELNKEDPMIKFSKKKYKMRGRINKKSLTEDIKIDLKTFHGARNKFSFSFNINDKIIDVIGKLCDEEEKLAQRDDSMKKWNKSLQFRLYIANGYIREINPLLTFKDEKIRNKEIFVLLNSPKIYFSDLNKGNYILLESNNKVAFKQGADELQFAIAEQGYTMGKRYCEFLLETEPYEKSVIIGVTIKRTDFSMNSSDMKGFWGFLLSECKKVSSTLTNKIERADYGDSTKIGDRVGILMEFNQNGLDISFFVNKVNMGVAFKNLPINTYYPCAVLGFDGTRLRISNKMSFPDI